MDAIHSDVNWNSIEFSQFGQRTVRKAKGGKKSYIDKVKVARKFCENDALKFDLDWGVKIQKLADNIRSANGM